VKNLKRVVLGVVLSTVTALILVVPTAASGLGLQNVTLTCNDGTNLALALDTTAVTALSNAVSAINLFPAGDPALACSLTQSTAGSFAPAASFSDRASSSSGSGNPNTDYAVGGGRATLFACVVDSTLISLETNFALNARVDATSNGAAGTGTFNVTIPQSSFAGCPPDPNNREGHFNGKIDCVLVSGNTAQATFRITQAAGSFSGSEGSRLVVNVLDSGTPGGTGDFIRLRSSSGPCDFGAFTATRPVDNGNISVHQAS
jgi:hypothetical protein